MKGNSSGYQAKESSQGDTVAFWNKNRVEINIELCMFLIIYIFKDSYESNLIKI